MANTPNDRISFFPEDLIALRKEVSKHPPLMDKLKDCHDLSLWFAEVGAYAEVVLDGYYYPEEFPDLCKLLLKRLYEKRAVKLVKIPSNSIFPQ